MPPSSWIYNWGARRTAPRLFSGTLRRRVRELVADLIDPTKAGEIRMLRQTLEMQRQLGQETVLQRQRIAVRLSLLGPEWDSEARILAAIDGMQREGDSLRVELATLRETGREVLLERDTAVAHLAATRGNLDETWREKERYRQRVEELSRDVRAYEPKLARARAWKTLARLKTILLDGARGDLAITRAKLDVQRARADRMETPRPDEPTSEYLRHLAGPMGIAPDLSQEEIEGHITEPSARLRAAEQAPKTPRPSEHSPDAADSEKAARRHLKAQIAELSGALDRARDAESRAEKEYGNLRVEFDRLSREKRAAESLLNELDGVERKMMQEAAELRAEVERLAVRLDALAAEKKVLFDESARQRQAIEAAPHDPACPSRNGCQSCTCWKSRALSPLVRVTDLPDVPPLVTGRVD